jgi:deferrochelatase/peroxidase EfeB
VDRENVQGLVLAPYRYRRSRHLLFTLPEGVDGRGFLRAIFPNIAHGATDLTLRSPCLCNVGLTYQGLSRIGCDPALIAALDAHFQEGPSPPTMGDMPDSPSDRSKWWDGQWKTSQIHLTVQIYAREPNDLAAATEEILNHATAYGWVELLPRKIPDYQGSRRLDGAALPRAEGDTSPGAKLHFGYRDGLSQPEVAWDAEPTNGKLDRAHFLLGYSKPEVSSAPSSRPAAKFFRDSSYFVLRWIQQDVAAFEHFLTDAAPKIAPERPLAEGREFVAAKLLGRWRDGTPLALSSERPDASLNSTPFGYQAQDSQGLRCPFSAHIRVVNPRDQPLANAEVFGVPRVIRRGMPYGPEWPEGQIVDDEMDRGIIGVFLCTSIARQFYTLLHWVF